MASNTAPHPARRGDAVVISLCRPRRPAHLDPSAGAPEPSCELCSSFAAALVALRGQAETPLEEAGRVFARRAEQRFPGVLRPLVTDGGYVAADFRTWADKPVGDLQAELKAAGIDAIRAAPLQNLAAQVFGGLPEAQFPAPPPLRALLVAMRDAIAGAAGGPGALPPEGGADQRGTVAAPTHSWPVAESATALEPDAPFLPGGGSAWEAAAADGGSPLAPQRFAAPEAPLSPSRWRPHQQQHANGGALPLSSPPAPGAAPMGGVYSSVPPPHAARSPSGGGQGFTPHVGYISTGGDILGSPRLLTVEEAFEVAAKYPECKGFSVRGEDPAPEGKQWVYFKDKWDIHGRGWTSYRKAAPQAAEHDAIGAAAARPAVALQRRSARVDPHLRQRLFSFYQHYNASKLPSVVSTLLEYAGFEEALFDALVRKYGPEPPDTTADALPLGWRLVESPSGDLFYRHIDGRKQWERPQPPLPPHAGPGPAPVLDDL
eukprot:TRINITY_DN4141_c2_g1_i3.p2 TRINITY_DN4141_c2_g1~~TRINITY_DN4141_c2_g1_i3.p2  ORF type:complete len:489 (+),score=140.73 TRINITY_DN4141_c2_g1_i3:1695-3161(+)